VMGEAMGEETVDELKKYDLRLMQPRHGYRFSLDPLLLCAFAAIDSGERAIDLGTGCGVMPLILARTAPTGSMVGVEFQAELAALAARNVALNGLCDRVAICHGDVLHVRQLFAVSSFDLVVANPPYRKQGTGRISPKAGRDTARHESTATLADFLAAAKYLVRPAGRICCIYHPSRLTELLTTAAALQLTPLRLRMVHGTITAEARMFLVELVKGRKGDLRIERPLFVFDAAGGYTEELQELLTAVPLHSPGVPPEVP
jgi:tRNA1Val (adenine37-N6)-methyltransferase